MLHGYSSHSKQVKSAYITTDVWLDFQPQFLLWMLWLALLRNYQAYSYVTVLWRSLEKLVLLSVKWKYVNLEEWDEIPHTRITLIFVANGMLPWKNWSHGCWALCWGSYAQLQIAAGCSQGTNPHVRRAVGLLCWWVVSVPVPSFSLVASMSPAALLSPEGWQGAKWIEGAWMPVSKHLCCRFSFSPVRQG